MAAWLEI